MKISLYSMEKLSHPACSKGSRLRKRYLKLLLKDFKGETVLPDTYFCRLIRRNLFLLAAGAKKPDMLFAITGRPSILMQFETGPVLIVRKIRAYAYFICSQHHVPKAGIKRKLLILLP